MPINGTATTQPAPADVHLKTKLSCSREEATVLESMVRLALAVAMVCATSHAEVLYNFAGIESLFGVAESFRYTSPAFIASDTFVPASALDSCSTGQSLPCFRVNFLPSG